MQRGVHSYYEFPYITAPAELKKKLHWFSNVTVQGGKIIEDPDMTEFKRQNNFSNLIRITPFQYELNLKRLCKSEGGPLDSFQARFVEWDYYVDKNFKVGFLSTFERPFRDYGLHITPELQVNVCDMT